MHAAVLELGRAATAAGHATSAPSTWAAVAGVAGLMLVWLALAIVFVRSRGHSGSDEDDGGWSGFGRGGPPPPDPDGPHIPGDGADWWPDFEREFADYIAARSASRN